MNLSTCAEQRISEHPPKASGAQNVKPVHKQPSNAGIPLQNDYENRKSRTVSPCYDQILRTRLQQHDDSRQNNSLSLVSVAIRINAESTASSSGPHSIVPFADMCVLRDPEPQAPVVCGATETNSLTSFPAHLSLPASAYWAGLSVDPHSNSFKSKFVDNSAGGMNCPREYSGRRKALCGAEHQRGEYL
jgi:hypothetical protein